MVGPLSLSTYSDIIRVQIFYVFLWQHMIDLDPDHSVIETVVYMYLMLLFKSADQTVNFLG